ncbi:hypothetical protein GCM10007919_23160 [Rhizobium indigoferae]|nr:hypothetical protein GCM10007919_23160 [Rhizobium indigoferae]
MIPETSPMATGTPEATAMPRQSGMATRKTTRDEARSRENAELFFMMSLFPGKRCRNPRHDMRVISPCEGDWQRLTLLHLGKTC